MSIIGTASVRRPDTEQLLAVHRAFRRELGLLPELVGRVADADRARVAAVADYLDDVLDALHEHRTAEQDLLWPALLQRVRLEAPVVRLMEEQHETICGLVATTWTRSAAWRATAARVEAMALAEAVAGLDRAVTRHLDDEELAILPLVERHLSAHEWRIVQHRRRANLSSATLFGFLSAVLEDCTADERRRVLAGLPPSTRIGWQLAGRRYRNRLRQLRTP